MTNDCKTCPVSTGTHKPAEAVHQIDEPQAEALRLAAELVEPIDGFQEPTMLEAAAAAELRRLHARIAELESQLEAIGAGGVEPLRKQVAAPQAVQAAVPATNHSETPNSSTIIVPYGWKLVPDDATPEWVTNLEALPDWREAVGECIKRFLAAAPAHPAEGVPAQAVGEMTAERASYFMRRFLKEEKLLGPNEQAALHYVISQLAATQPAAQGLEADLTDEQIDEAFNQMPDGAAAGWVEACNRAV